jgi:NADH-quinone oxidoreductase subunit M
VVGVFTALDAFLFFFCWEITMIPTYCMIALWGGPQRTRASIKFLLFSLAGGLLILTGILILHHAGGTSDMLALMQTEYAPKVQFWIFLALFLGLPSWCPCSRSRLARRRARGGAHRGQRHPLRAPAEDGGLRAYPVLSPHAPPRPSAAFAPLIQWLSVLAILYGGAMAIAQPNFKRLIAYSSIAHMGFVTLGIFGLNTQSVQGAVLQMVNHGITTGALFLLAGMLYDRTHDRTINNYGGCIR